jgi:L-malate glycosyltransferase
MIHLAFLTPEYPHPSSTTYAGLGTSIKNLAEGLILKETKVSIFVYGQKEDLKFTENKIKFHFIRQRNYPFLGWYLYRKFLESYINKAISTERIDILEAPDWTGITAFIKFKCPLVVRLHGSDTYFCKLENRKQKKKNFWFEKTALSQADHLLSVSEFTAKKTKQIFNLNRNITVIPNSVDLKFFQPAIDTKPSETLLYFGSIIRKKGVLELAEIFNLVSEKKENVKLILAGKDVKDIRTGRSTMEIFREKLSTKASENIDWLGNLPYNKIKTLISKASIVVFPSFAEALPMTWLEAMAMEKPMVTSNIGWANELIIDGKNGFTVDPKDHRLFGDRIIQLLDDHDLTRNMGKAARKQVNDKFSNRVVINQNFNFYSEVIKSE